MSEQDWPVYYYWLTNSTAFWVDDGRARLPVPAIGDGVDPPTDHRRGRVVDRWLSFDSDGVFGAGWHIFLEPLEPHSESDRLGWLRPDYFRDDEGNPV